MHIRDGSRGRGIGSRLLTQLIGHARGAGKHVMIAAVDSENAGSLRFLERHGFVLRGRLPEVGFKFGRHLDLALLHLWIAPPQNAPASPTTKT